MTKITFEVAEIIIREDVIISYVPKITYVVAEIILKWLWSLLSWPRSLV